MLFKRLSFYLAVAGIAGAVYLVTKLNSAPPPPPPLVEPARSPYSTAVAASGLIEAARENVRIATLKPGVVTKVFVEVGAKVKPGDPLFQLDDREARAKLAGERAQLEALRAVVKTEEVLQDDLRDQMSRVEKLSQKNVASEDELKRKWFQVELQQARIARAKAEIQSAEAKLRQAEVDLELLTVRAPRDGTILQLNTRGGEYASPSAVESLMILGETDVLQIRADVDEQNAPLVKAGQPAVAYIKGDTENPIPLRFVRIEPFVIPKRSLTGDSVERVDTRVLQVIFLFDRPKASVYVGQQVDVFIQRGENTPSGN